MASEWVQLIFEEEIRDMATHIVNHWLYDIVENVNDRVAVDLNYDDWLEADDETRIMWTGEAFDREIDKVDDLTEEDERVISIYYDKIIKTIAESI
jgi:hypothetical protein